MLHHLFNRKNFFPHKAPIYAPGFDSGKFVVINITNYSNSTADYLNRINDVLERHTDTNTSFMILMSLIFDGRAHDIKKVLEYLNRTSYELHYLVLTSSYYDQEPMKEQDLEQLRRFITKGRIHLFDTLVTQSSLRFKQRRDEVAKLISDIV
ncbi:hypothetical protein MMC2321_04880 [Chitinophaga sp. MM2321]